MNITPESTLKSIVMNYKCINFIVFIKQKSPSYYGLICLNSVCLYFKITTFKYKNRNDYFNIIYINYISLVEYISSFIGSSFLRFLIYGKSSPDSS